jgi:hypothetical protein
MTDGPIEAHSKSRAKFNRLEKSSPNKFQFKYIYGFHVQGEHKNYIITSDFHALVRVKTMQEHMKYFVI